MWIFYLTLIFLCRILCSARRPRKMPSILLRRGQGNSRRHLISAITPLILFHQIRPFVSCLSPVSPRRIITMTAKATAEADGEAAPIPSLTNGDGRGMFSSYKDAALHVSQTVLDSAKNAKKCGDLACQHDSFQTQFDNGSILSYAVYEDKPASSSSKKKKKKKSSSSKKDGEGENVAKTKYALTLSDSVFFPEGGGQPADKGFITIGNDNDTKLQVSDAQNVNNICVLSCEAPSGVSHDKIQDLLTTASADEDDVTAVKQEIDWDRRFDLMTQHSGQHLVSAVAVNEFNLLTHSFHLQQKGLLSYIDFTIDADVSMEINYENMKTVEKMCNEKILQNLSMKPTWLDPDDPEYQRRVRSRLLPEGLTGKIRLVEIDGGKLDCNTCCGTHVPSLGSLQMLKFFKMERVKSTTMRVYFATGKRLLKVMETMYDRQATFTNMLSCNEEEHVDRLTQMLNDKKAKERETKMLQEELCECRTREIVEECSKYNNIAVVNLGGLADMNFMGILSTKVLEEIGTTEDNNGILLLFVAAGDDTEEGSFLLSGDPDLVDKVGKQTAELLGGRGGGRKGRFQGKGTKLKSALPDAKQLLMNVKLA